MDLELQKEMYLSHSEIPVGYSTSFKSDVIIHEVSGNKMTGRMMLYSYASGQWWRPLNS